MNSNSRYVGISSLAFKKGFVKIRGYAQYGMVTRAAFETFLSSIQMNVFLLA